MGVTVLDAGVLIAVMDRDDAHHAAALAALESAIGRDELVLPASAYAEILVVPSRLGQDAVRRTDELIDALPARIEPVSRGIARAAARLRATHGRRLKLGDALVIGTAEAVAATRVLTTDRGWPTVELAVELVSGAS